MTCKGGGVGGAQGLQGHQSASVQGMAAELQFSSLLSSAPSAPFPPPPSNHITEPLSSFIAPHVFPE